MYINGPTEPVMQSASNSSHIPTASSADDIASCACQLDESANHHCTSHEQQLEMKIEGDMLKTEYFAPTDRNEHPEERLQQLMQVLEEDGGSPRCRQLSGEGYSKGSTGMYFMANSMENSSMLSYRNQPLDDDDATRMTCNGMIPLRTGELSISTDEQTTSYVSGHNSPTGPQGLSERDAATISALLDPSNRINLSDNSVYDVHEDYESPRKMSRVSSGEGAVNADKLFSAELATSPDKDFIPRMFGMEVSTDQSTPDSATNSGFGRSRMADQSHGPSPVSPNLPLMSSLDQHYDRVSTSDSYHQMPRHLPRKIIPRTPPLTDQFPNRQGQIMLKITKQPEAQHRARYLTEGSRGAVKDVEQQGHPIVQLLGWNEDARLEVFIGTDTGKVKPHGFYQACRISGKNASSSREKSVDGTSVIEMELEQSKNMTAVIDCIGILKLRNTDVEKRTGQVKLKNKKSTKCRLVFRVNLRLVDGTVKTLQTASTVIACTQPAGQPEINKMSLSSAPLTGGSELFVIGKNFNKGFSVKFQQVDESDSEKVVWEKLADIDQEYTHQTHFICTVPEYTGQSFSESVTTQVLVTASGGASEPVPFTYHPESAKEMVVSPTTSKPPTVVDCHPTGSSNASGRNSAAPGRCTLTTTGISQNSPPSIVSPEALELVAQIQQQASSRPNKPFQIPDGVDFISKDSNSAPQLGDYKPVLFSNSTNGIRFPSTMPNMQETTTLTSSTNHMTDSEFLCQP